MIQYLNRLQIFDRLYGVECPHLYEKALLNEVSYEINDKYYLLSYEAMLEVMDVKDDEEDKNKEEDVNDDVDENEEEAKEE